MPEFYLDPHNIIVLRNFLFMLHFSYFIFSKQVSYLLDKSNLITYYINNFSIILTSSYFFIKPLIFNSNFYINYHQFFTFWDKFEYFIRFICLVVNMFDIILNSNYLLILWNIYLYIYISVKYFITFSKRLKTEFKEIILPGEEIESFDTCSICFEQNIDWKLPCHHKLHKVCLVKWFKINSSCPICRKKYFNN